VALGKMKRLCGTYQSYTCVEVFMRLHKTNSERVWGVMHPSASHPAATEVNAWEVIVVDRWVSRVVGAMEAEGRMKYRRMRKEHKYQQC
jgi:hypothetical protein